MKTKLTDEILVWVKALKNGDIERIKELDSADAFVDETWVSVLPWAAEHNHLEVVKHFIPKMEFDHKLHARAVRIACQYGHLEMVKLLYPPDPKKYPFLPGMCSEHAIYHSIREGYPEITKHLMKHGVNWRRLPTGNHKVVIAKLREQGFKVPKNPYSTPNETTELQDED